jgi:transposase InsO family protein
VARLLKAAGQSKRRRRPVRVWHVDGRPHIEVKLPNDLWTIDFKGWWRAKNKQRCEPLTVRDAYSRKILAVVVVDKANATTVRRVLEKLFELHGMPKAMLMDNGSPWINVRARGGLTRLSAWLVSLGIKLHRSRVAKPQDNGGHERMHLDLDELSLEPGRSRRHQQLLCDQWTMDFNHVRPHDALGGKTPAEVYGTPRPTPATVQIPTYPPGFVTRRVRANGTISMGGDVAGLGRALIGHLVGLQYVSGLRWRVSFFTCELGEIELCPHHILNTESPKKPLQRSL